MQWFISFSLFCATATALRGVDAFTPPAPLSDIVGRLERSSPSGRCVERFAAGTSDGDELSLAEIAFRAINQAEDEKSERSATFLRQVSNEMDSLGLPESWRPEEIPVAEKPEAEEVKSSADEEAAVKKPEAEEVKSSAEEEPVAKKPEAEEVKSSAEDSIKKEEPAATKTDQKKIEETKSTVEASKPEPAKKKQPATKTVEQEVVAEIPLTKPRKVAPKKSAAKEITNTPKVEELPTAETPTEKTPPKDAAPVKKATGKKAATKKGDLTTLTKSALNRTTVKVLVGFLESKGVVTVDENGKTLKKALLLEAVRSL